VRKLANKPLILYKKDSKYKGKLKAITPESYIDEEDAKDKDSNEELIMEIAALIPARSRRIRNINLPKRYRN